MAVWRHLWRRAYGELGILLASLAAAVAVVLAAGHAALVVVLWLIFAAALLRRPVATPEEVQTVDDAPPKPPDLEALGAGFDALDTPILVVGPDEAVLFQNQAAEKAFGVIPPFTDLSARVRSPGILDMVRETIATGRANQIEHSERLPSEMVYVVRVARATVDEARQTTVYVISYRDISQARRIDRMRSDFVANASHELRTPLASLRGFIETLQGPARNDAKAQERFLGIMLEQATRMSRLVDDLLSLSRLELKAHIAPSDEVDLVPLLGHVRDALGPLSRELDVCIEFAQPSSPAIVQGDRDELIEVFENLVENACKYGQEGKKVEISVSGGGAEPTEVSVRDYGPGIPAEHVPRITERFYRVNVEASRSKKGTGLGLAIVKHILTRHRARLIVRSTLGEGTVFTVRF
ncbi:phosphate regulon sensor histidine kinase PhoR [Rhizobium sp. YIM 134829]|uniref:phosphate regulon sensor histidine kinase PhoR n=1 Tax=Rhizobium sp. YIM 134829 TaxID=3390453 RepID=UPI0039796AFA